MVPGRCTNCAARSAKLPNSLKRQVIFGQIGSSSLGEISSTKKFKAEKRRSGGNVFRKAKQRKFVGNLKKIQLVEFAKSPKTNKVRRTIAILLAKRLKKSTKISKEDIAAELGVYLREKLGRQIAPTTKAIELVLTIMEKEGLVEVK
jgi:hypothetical protein